MTVGFHFSPGNELYLVFNLTVFADVALSVGEGARQIHQICNGVALLDFLEWRVTFKS